MIRVPRPALFLAATLLCTGSFHAQVAKPATARIDPRLEKLKAEALTKVDARATLIQQIIDQVFSFDFSRRI